jgi:hypothetical protein
MTRRDLLGAAVAVAPFAVADPPAAPQSGPTVEQLINLAEHGPHSEYYGRLLADCLDQTGTVARDNGDGTVSLYSPEWPRSAWTKRTVSNSGRPVPAGLLIHVQPANRGEDFPSGVGFKPLT